MRNSNFSLNRRILAWPLTALAAIAFAPTARALDPNRAMIQYTRDHWGADRGFPLGPVHGIAQTPDGFLWIATAKGLVQFDGLEFRLFDHARFTAMPPGPVLGLATDATGSLWIRTERPGLLRYSEGTLTDTGAELVWQYAGVTSMARVRDGGLMVAGMGSAVRFKGGKSTTFSLPGSFLVLSMAEGGDGRIWFGARDAGLGFWSDGRFQTITEGIPDRKINSLLAAGAGELWVGTDNGLVLWDGLRAVRQDALASLDKTSILALARDRDTNTWIATARGLYRFNAAGLCLLAPRDARYGTSVTALFEDREGALWFGTAGGLERLRETAFLSYSPPRNSSQGNSGPLFADIHGRIWFAPSAGGLFWLKNGHTERAPVAGLGDDIVYSISGGSDEIWIGRQRGGLTCLRWNGPKLESRTYTSADGLAADGVYAVHRSRDGAVWAGTLSAGLSKIAGGRITSYTASSGLAANSVGAVEEGHDGAMWFATPGGLSSFAANRWRTYDGRNGLPSAAVNCLFEDSKGILWIGTAEGLVFLRSGEIEAPAPPSEALREAVMGIAEDRKGALWISTATRVISAPRDFLLGGLKSEAAAIREWGMADGLNGAAGVNRSRSAATDSLGRIWLSLDGGISMVDPSRLIYAPEVLITGRAILADGKPFPPHGRARIPPQPRRIVLSYAGLNLSAPNQIMYRSKLEHSDRAWSSPTESREAGYTDLAPGDYKFQVVASNPGGPWSSPTTVAEFHIESEFWQTPWFRLSAALAMALAIALAYRLRIRGLTGRLNLRFEERLMERTRIAQELHDTLLQGFLSASMQLHVAADALPENSPAQHSLVRILALMSRVIEEGRNAVKGLRSVEPETRRLEQEFSRIGQEFCGGGDFGFRVIVEGKPRPLHPLIRDEVYRIGREALVNAFRHSRGHRIEMEVDYAADHLRIAVRDDGRGIEANVLKAGREGHWGLPGMRERAERIGARLRLWSSSSSGTEVDLTVPASVAFLSTSKRRFRNGLPQWLSRSFSLSGPERKR